MDVSYDGLIAETSQLAKKDVNLALEKLLATEKQTRTGGDAIGNGQILVHIANICFGHSIDLLVEHLTVLSKKHGFLKQAVTKMMQQTLLFVDKVTDQTLKMKLIDTIRTVTEGKIFLEVERARITRILAAIKEQQGHITEATSIMLDIQIETFGSLEKREKTDFILEQMRLALATKDLARTLILSNKISTKFLNETDSQVTTTN
jgi:26S proteasome regulatory subunit N5